ncbi:hypothetical protein [Streptomyces sp. G45]|uniref:hypothetical protein n=1 Tax=Streptomyces sp. G45 TaxID=3406627 RepID=UPI003C134849
MREAAARAVVAGGVALVLVAGAGTGVAGARGAETGGAGARGAGGGHHHYRLQHSDIPWSGSPSPFESRLKLPDGRRVALHYLKRKGLYVQDYSPRERGWSKPKAVYRTRADVCQGITLTARAGTVAAIADWGTYCYDGEPPQTSLAAVATGGLTTWERHITRHFDGWTRADIARDGKRVTFKHHADRLRWTKGGGFTKG